MTVTDNPHATGWHQRLAEDNIILRAQVGSGLHGVIVARTDDRDEIGIPGAYKDVDRVMSDASDMVSVDHVLHQLLTVKGT